MLCSAEKKNFLSSNMTVISRFVKKIKKMYAPFLTSPSYLRSSLIHEYINSHVIIEKTCTILKKKKKNKTNICKT